MSHSLVPFLEDMHDFIVHTRCFHGDGTALTLTSGDLCISARL